MQGPQITAYLLQDSLVDTHESRKPPRRPFSAENGTRLAFDSLHLLTGY